MVLAQTQVQNNKDLGIDKASFLFVLGLILLTDADLFLTLRSEGEAKVLFIPKVTRSFEEPLQPDNIDNLPLLDKTKLLYLINKVTGIHCLCILLSVP